jgi:hypothetical protein
MFWFIVGYRADDHTRHSGDHISRHDVAGDYISRDDLASVFPNYDVLDPRTATAYYGDVVGLRRGRSDPGHTHV